MNRKHLALHLALVATAIGVAVFVIQLAVEPPRGDLVLAAALMGASGLVATIMGHAAVSISPQARIGGLAVRLGVVSALASVLALACILLVAQLMFISRHDISLLLALLIFSLAVAVPLALAVAGSLATSLDDLGHGAAAMANGDLSARVSVRGSDELARLATAFNDMAERLEASIRQQSDLEEARRSLVASVSHDLRTPLASLRAAAEALTDGVVSDPPTVERYLASIHTEAERLGALIDDLFELSLIDAGKLRLHMEPTSLADLISDTLEGMSHQARQKGVHLSAPIPPDLGTVVADPLKIQRVILNLVQNAIRHTPGDGTVSLEVEAEERAVAVSVSDTCGGLRPLDADHAFEPFYRGDPSRPRDGGGAGLGLSIARGIVEAHGGRIWVDNAPGTGCRFCFTLPSADAA